MKTRAHSRFRSDLAFLDAILNMTLAFTFLFVVAFMLIRPHSPTMKNADLKAEFIITMTWPEETLDDIDMWVMLPDGRRVMYMNKDVEYVTLDRDDRGGYGDTYSTSEGDMGPKKLIRTNKEMITIRAIVPGRYVVAAHVFGISEFVDGIKTDKHLPYEARLEITKVNPRVTEVAKANVFLERPRQQKAFIAFTVGEDGFVSDVEIHPPDEIVTSE